MIRPSCTREEKNKRKKERRMLLPSHGVIDFTSRHEIRSSSGCGHSCIYGFVNHAATNTVFT